MITVPAITKQAEINNMRHSQDVSNNPEKMNIAVCRPLSDFGHVKEVFDEHLRRYEEKI
jgi:hypothetical protein